jgi:hypothetical protein
VLFVLRPIIVDQLHVLKVCLIVAKVSVITPLQLLMADALNHNLQLQLSYSVTVQPLLYSAVRHYCTSYQQSITYSLCCMPCCPLLCAVITSVLPVTTRMSLCQHHQSSLHSVLVQCFQLHAWCVQYCSGLHHYT